MNYKIVLCADRFYQEIELSNETKSFKIGTTKDCEIRLSENLIPEVFEIRVEKEREWRLLCSHDIQIRTNSGEEKHCCIPSHGERLKVYHSNYKKELFCIDYYRDFEVKNVNYDMCIDYAGISAFSVGNRGCDIEILDAIVEDDEIRVVVEEAGLLLDTRLCKYGVAVNGIPVTGQKVRIRDKDFFSVKGFQFFAYDTKLFTTGDGRINTEIPWKIVCYQNNHFKYPKFVKNVRQRFLLPNEQIEILDPKALPSKPDDNILFSFLPTIMAMILIVVVRGSTGGGTFIVYSVAMMGMGLVTSIMTFRAKRKKYKKEVEEREKKYKDYLEEKEKEISQIRNQEYEISCNNLPSLEEDIKRVAQFDHTIFEKKKEHDDYLMIRLGKGIVQTLLTVKYRAHEYLETSDYLMDYPKSISEKYEYIQDMPVALDLKKENAIGFVGTRTKLYQIAKNMILQLAVEHFYNDVKFFFILNSQDISQFEWARWLQNTYMEEREIRNYLYDETSAKVVLEYIYKELSIREKISESALKQCPNIILFVYRSERISTHPIMKYVDKAKKLGFTFLFFEEFEELLNEHCGKRIFLNSDDNSGYIQEAENGNIIQKFVYEHVPRDIAIQTALKLGCVYVDEVNLESALTKSISLFEMLNIVSVRDIELGKRWTCSKVYESMAVPIGVKGDGEVVCLDIHEKHHGPHGLVAGTTGSGKSEILQSYILSMATLFHPYEVGFIIIDFKGGGLVNQLRQLPHLNGAITNIDGKEINRSLLSIRAELHKRQTLFTEYEVNHIDDYIRKFKDGVTTIPLPHLILIVDEFAELKSEQPEFMKELISAARIGRSLGVHLILATQKPSGVINEQIWSNSKFRLCLKVQTQSDSNEIIKSPLAAEIREPGRAYLQVGNNEVFQLFQSAYSSAVVPNGSMGELRSFSINKVDLCGRREKIYEQKPIEEKNGCTQLQSLVQYIAEFCEKNKISRLPNICLPPLGKNIIYGSGDYSVRTKDISVSIGLYDAPDKQYQGVIEANLSQEHVFILGSTQMGKTNLLQCILKGIALRYSSDEVNVYVLDFATQILKKFDKLRHVCDVVTQSEVEKVQIFIKTLNKELMERKARFAELGFSSYSSYRESEECDIPQIIVLIDNIGILRENYPRMEDDLLKIVKEGISVGICVIMTAPQSTGLGYKYLSHFGKKVVLFCNDSGEYATALGHCRIKLEQIAGRCLTEVDGEIYEGQIYKAFSSEREIERISEIQEFIREVNESDKGKGGGKLPVIPENVTKEMLDSMIKEPLTSYTVPLGINYSTLDVDTINLKTFTLMAMCGGTERILFINNILKYLTEKKTQLTTDIYILDEAQECLKKWSEECLMYITKADEIKNILLMAKERIENERNCNFQYIILNQRDAYKLIDADEEVYELYKFLLSESKYGKISVLLADVPNENIMFHQSAVIKMLRFSNNLLMFCPLDEIKLVDLKTEIKCKYKENEHCKGDMYFKCGEYFGKYKTALENNLI